MFSPETFYKNLHERLSFSEKYEIWVPRRDGLRDLISYKLFGPYSQIEELYQATDFYNRTTYKKVWMYDQEPLFLGAFDTYIMRMRDWTEPEYHDFIDQYRSIDLSPCMMRTTTFPIWCTSELDCAETKALQQNHYIMCYYWYHALIAREWFRHWQYHPALEVRDRSQAPHRFLAYARDFSGTRVYRHRMLDSLRRWECSIHTNWSKNSWVPAEYSAHIEPADADLASIHLVAETLFDRDKMYLTEKVFKPMVMSQPFIVWGPPGTLAYLRSYGFRTFDTIWSEQYDQETDHDKRMDILIQLVGELAQMDPLQYRDLYLRCLPIVEHNRNRFFSQEFMDHCWQELLDNFKQAHEQRQTMDQEHPGGQFCLSVGRDPELCRVPTVQASLKQILQGMPDDKRKILLDRYPHFNAR